MADFTIRLKDVVNHLFSTSTEKYDFEQSYISVTYEGINYGKLPTVPDWNQLGMGYYPIFDEAYRPILNGKILDEFYMREIGQETIGMWTLSMRRRLNNAMPYFNKLYESEKIPYNALDTMNIVSNRNDTVHETQAATGENTSTNDTTSAARAVSSSTPNTMLSGDEDYATGATDTNSQSHANVTSNNTTNNTNDVTNDGSSTVTGYQAAASDLINKFRASLLNIDMMVIRELQPCFMNILNSSDDYSKRGYWA